jgi:hypothetical protein
MKKILALVSVLITAAACTAPETTNRPMNANTAAETKPAAAPLTEAEAVAREKAAWDAIKNKDYDAFANMLANEQIFVAPDGVYDKAGTVDGVKTFEPTEVNFSDWKFVPVDKDAVLIIYTTDVKAKMNGKEMPPEKVRSSTAWVNRDGKWLSIYHQECPVKPPPPPPPAAGTKPKPATSPAATPVTVVTGPDAETNEKAIWDALKHKNLDGFASALAPESIEVEPEGVFDKAGTLKMIGQFDFSKAIASDFKTVKFDADASLVTYLVKIPGMSPNGERHSTIWVNRSGKWMALFHHGTPAVAGPPPPKAGASPSAKPSGSPSAKPSTSPRAKPAATK